MQALSLALPFLFADHHVTEVRRILFEIPGVQTVYASSAFQSVEITFDETRVAGDDLCKALEAAGYLRSLSMPMEPSSASGVRSGDQRRVTDLDPSGQRLRFTRPLNSDDTSAWPCPGFGLLGGE